MRSSWNMWEPTWVSRSRCWLLTGERLGHVCMVPEPVGSTHLRFVDARVIKEVLYVVTECCSESRMRSRTSRGVLEWSGGKDLYIGSMVLATGSVLGITGSVPGPPEVSGGPPSGATIPGGLRGPSVGGDQPQVGWCAPPTSAQGARERRRGQTLWQMGPKAHAPCASLSSPLGRLPLPHLGLPPP